MCHGRGSRARSCPSVSSEEESGGVGLKLEPAIRTGETPGGLNLLAADLSPIGQVVLAWADPNPDSPVDGLIPPSQLYVPHYLDPVALVQGLHLADDARGVRFREGVQFARCFAEDPSHRPSERQ